MSQITKRFILIVFITLISLIISLPKDFPINFSFFGHPVSFNLRHPSINLNFNDRQVIHPLDTKLGLDLSGGTRITLEANMSSLDPQDRQDALESVKEIISRRVDLFGVSEPNIYSLQSEDGYQIIVELASLDDPQSALDLIGTTAQLIFMTPIYESDPASPSAEALLTNFIPSELTGADLKKTQVTFDDQTREPVVALEFLPSGSEKFANLTKSYLGQPLAIAIDNQIITAPVIQSEILDGKAIISGDFTTESAKELSIQLNAGALPVPVNIVSQNTIDASLGSDSVQQSLRAGAVGLSLVIGFMSIYYGFLGILASIGLVIYGLITFALYRLIPVTLTLPGIAGFILSVGMAVDSNILIFERYKEEIKNNRPWQTAIELGFGRAWDSIKDANIATLITAFILFNPLNWSFLPTSGPVRGFALTLALGIFTSLFTGIFVTRTLIRLFYRGPHQLSTQKKS